METEIKNVYRALNFRGYTSIPESGGKIFDEGVRDTSTRTTQGGGRFHENNSGIGQFTITKTFSKKESMRHIL